MGAPLPFDAVPTISVRPWPMRRKGATMAGGGAVVHDDLPAYFDEPEPEPHPAGRPATALLARPRSAVRSWPAAELVPVGAAVQPATPTTVVVQVVPLWPDVAARRLAAWATATATRRRPWSAGRDRLVVGPAPARPSAGRGCCAWHVRVDVRGHGRPPLPVEVGCGAWSSTRAELHVVPVRTVRDRRRYYRAAHAVLDRLVRDLR